jgi:BirA family transcriptional regulator, biotin operon repressor / biotin---[acetyl-CoA-carboxylase] ligase
MILFNIVHLQEVNSTNNYLKEISRKGNVVEGTVIMADFQSAGRGRGNNIWLSEANHNITMSVLIRPSIKAPHQFVLNEMLSLSVIDLLDDLHISASIKWPNDIYCQDKKIAGFLIENVVMGDRIVESILGIGLNVNQLHFSESLPNPVSIARVLGRTLVLSELAEKLLSFLGIRYDSLQKESYSALHAAYCSRVYKKGQPIGYVSAGKKQEGILTDVAPDGELIIRKPDGHTEGFLFGEIQLLV